MTYYPYRHDASKGYFVALVLVLFILLVIITKSKEN